jgi:5-methylcytosine-specific restriction endonuclease McrA
MIREEVVQQLKATGKWSENDARLGEQANYRCEYCDLDLFETVENYKLWQIDHIIPIRCGGSPDNPDNLALTCKTCNWNWKARWDPRTRESDGTRKKLIKAVRQYVAEQRHKAEAELEGFKATVGYGLS